MSTLAERLFVLFPVCLPLLTPAPGTLMIIADSHFEDIFACIFTLAGFPIYPLPPV